MMPDPEACTFTQMYNWAIRAKRDDYMPKKVDGPGSLDSGRFRCRSTNRAVLSAARETQIRYCSVGSIVLNDHFLG